MPAVEQETEAERVRRWREHAALYAGLTPQQAEAFAAGPGDLETLRQLMQHGCDRDTAFDIVT